VNSFRSVDGGPWQDVANVYAGQATPSSCVFADNDSTLLYAASPWGLYFSGDMGDTWTPASGALGKVEITGLNWGKADGHILIYAATNGGDAGTAAAASKAKGVTSLAVSVAPPAVSSLVGAGIYRRAQVTSSKSLSSWGSKDGWLLESSHTSSRGGSTSASATTFRLGDDASKKQYRAILSFSTSSIPDGAVITGVTLKFRKQGVTGGGDPVAKFNGFMIDMKKGYFGTRTTLQAGDFRASASKTYGAFKPALSGGWYSINLTSAKAYINKTSAHAGLTQIRLRFKLDDNNNRVANYLRLYSGNAATSSRPQLIVTYYMP